MPSVVGIDGYAVYWIGAALFIAGAAIWALVRR